MRRVGESLRASLLVSVVATGLGGLGCGGAEESVPRPSGRPLTAAPAAQEAGSNAAPVVERVRLDPAEPVPGVPVSAVVEVADADGDPLRLSYEWRVNGVTVTQSNRPAVSLDSLEKGDQIEVVVVASDGKLESRPRRAQGEVANRPPYLEGVTFTPEGDVRPGDEILASPSGRDPDQDELSYEYSWFVNGVERGHSRQLATGDLSRGDRVRVVVVAFDGTARSRPLETPELVLGNTPPRITALPQLETDSGEFRYTFEAVDGDGDRNLRFWLEQSPPGMKIDPILGVLSWRPGPSMAGVHPVEVGVKDGHGEGTTFLFEVTVTSQPGEAAAAPPAAPLR